MEALDPFTRTRLQATVQRVRKRTGQLPTHRDLITEGFTEAQIKRAIQEKVIEEFYVTLTQGTIVKAFKVPS